MWVGNVEIKDLRSRDIWKVEFYTSVPLPTLRSAFPLWELEKLVTERRETEDPQLSPDRSMNYLGLENVQSATGDLTNFAPKLGKEIRSRSKVFWPDDILYGRLRPNLNKVYLAEGLVDRGICSGEFLVLIPNLEVIRPRYLRAVLSSPFVTSMSQIGRLEPLCRA